MTDGSCPVCANPHTHALTRAYSANNYDRMCPCGFRWVIYAKVTPGDHYIDVSGIVAQAVHDALVIRNSIYDLALQAIIEIQPSEIQPEADDTHTWLSCLSCGQMQGIAAEALQSTTQEVTL